MSGGVSHVADLELATLSAKVADHRASDVYFLAGEIERRQAATFNQCVLDNAKRPNALILLTTFGGSGDAAYQMARCLQNKYKDGSVAVLVSSYCKSAGTLLALGASKIIMTDTAELGPLDVQIMKPDTLGERTSGLTPSQSLSTLRTEAFECFEKFFLDILASSGYAITTRTAALIAANVTAGLYRPVYAQIDPMRLGEFQRAVQIAWEYGRRLEAWSKNLKDRSLAKLITGYPSHEFVIDRQEAETLFNDVEVPLPDELNLTELLRGDSLRGAGGGNDIRYLGSGGERPKDGSGTPRTASRTESRAAKPRTSPAGNGSSDRARSRRQDKEG